MYILGINAFHGDSSAALIKNGEVVCASEEERFRRIKHWAGFPSESIKFCLQDEGIVISDIDYIAISRDPRVNVLSKLIYTFKNRISLETVRDRLLNIRKVKSVRSELANLFSVKESDIIARVHNIEHHRSHLGSSFFASRFKNSAILSIDGFGDFTSTMTAVGDKNKVKILDSLRYPHSLGIFYTTVTQFLGFQKYGDEYKVMGLSSYGEPKYVDKLLQIIFKSEDGFFTLNKRYFNHFKEGVAMQWDNGEPKINNLFTSEWQKLFGQSRKEGDKFDQWHLDFAASAQKITEEIVFHILNKLYEQTKLDSICIAGGVAQNSVLNGKILDNTPFKNIYIPSASHDAGTSIGAALYLYHHILNQDRMPEIKTAFFGKRYTNEEIISCLESKDIKYERVDDQRLFDKVTDKLIEGGVVGWFQGRSEFGPRALGNRSIIVDPRRKDVQDLLNRKIKRRESFRPFAPSILEESIPEYFIQNDCSRFMEKVYFIKEEKRSEIPAVTHVDGSGRLQSVHKDISPKYYSLISKFKEKSGVPILLNTSFNENEPIVNLPDEALDCYLRTKMDMLVMENIVIER